MVEVVLRRDVVLVATRWACEVELGSEGNVRVVERNEPKAEELGDVEEENHVGGVVGDTVDFELDLGAQELVPFVNGVNQIATAFE